ncbi:MAG: aldehyde ferredoxin oxidoreductase N-terminal domain-containing protein, partial [Planctomycetota bacterium]
GDAVRRGVPTAARATLTAPVPRREGLAEAQFGGGFGAAFARSLDALIVVGRTGEARVLEIGADGEVGIASARDALGVEFASLGTSARAAALTARTRGAHVLTAGPAADAGVPFANLASFDGADPDGAPSLVGRGGLGSAVRSSGIVAIVAADDGRAVHSPDADALRALLVRSPRLLSRAVGGTLELGELRDGPLEVGDAPREKNGCRGCPTPCGWRFDVNVRGGGARVNGRFSALQGFAGRDDALDLVERCNKLGLDARAAASLLVDSDEESDPFRFLDAIVREGSSAHRASVALTEPGATGARADLAARVGQALAARGPEPVRSLSLFGLSGIAPAEIVDPLPWTGDAEADAGTLARWHECFAAAIDVTGFCAFSAAGLVADGLATPTEIGAILCPAPRGTDRGDGWGFDADPGRAMLWAGSSHVALHREWIGPRFAERVRALERDAPAAVAAYERAAALGFEPPGNEAPAAAPVRSGAPSGAPGIARVLARGVLASQLASHPRRSSPARGDGALELVLDVPSGGLRAGEIVRAIAAEHPSAAPWLVDERGRPVPAVVAGSRRVLPDEVVAPESLIELILAIPGG